MQFLWLLPVFASVLILFAFLSNFLAEVTRGRIRLLLYPACDQPNHPVYSGIVIEALNVAAVLIAATIYLKHRHALEYFSETRHRRRAVIISSRCFFVLGYLAAIALSAAANFSGQGATEIRLIAFLITFATGMVYCWCHGIFSFFVPPDMTSRRLAQCRVSIAFCSLVFFCGSFADLFCNPQPFDDFKRETTTKAAVTSGVTPHAAAACPWEPSVILYYISAISECALVLSLTLFLLTISCDLFTAKLLAPKLHLRHVEQQPTAFLDNYRLEYLSNSNPNVHKPGPVSVQDTTAPESIRTYALPVDHVHQTVVQEADAAGSEETEESAEPDEAEQEEEDESTDREPTPATLAAVSANSYLGSSSSERIYRRESMSASGAQAPQKQVAFSYIPGMPNPFNQMGQLKKVYE